MCPLFRWFGCDNDACFAYLPMLTSSPKRNEAMTMVKTRLSGIDMDRNTGPFFSITQICR